MTSNSQVQGTICRVQDDMPPEVLLPLLHDLQLALPWLATGVPGAMAGITTYLQRCGDTHQWQALQNRLEQGDDAGLQALACMVFHQLRASCERQQGRIAPAPAKFAGIAYTGAAIPAAGGGCINP